MCTRAAVMPLRSTCDIGWHARPSQGSFFSWLPVPKDTRHRALPICFFKKQKLSSHQALALEHTEKAM